MRAAAVALGASAACAAAPSLRQSDLIAAAPGAPASLGQFVACGWSMWGSTFDLSATHHTTAQGVYNVPDVRDTGTRYYFNPCDQVAMPDPSCSDTSRPNNTLPATGWQVEVGTPSNQCYRLGSSSASGWNFSFYDVNYPNRGVVMTYAGGDSVWCPNTAPGGGPASRSLSLELVCDPSYNPASADYSAGLSVREENSCDYRVQVPSLAGCPLECTTGGNLCNGHGVCGFNNDAQRSQCYCYNGWGGNKCDTATSSGPLSTEGILLILVSLALTAVVGLVVFMFVRLRKLQVDPAAYENLQGRFNELGQLT